MNKSFLRLLPSLIFAILLFLVPSWNEVSAYSTDAETQSVILYVKPGANGTCSSWSDACELQTALFNAVAGDQIWVAAGTYKPTTSTNRSATFQLMSGVAIYGGFPAAGGEWFQRNWITNLTTLNGDIGVVGNTGDNSYHVVTGSGVDATAVLDGFTISGGYAINTGNIDYGGGMYNDNSSPSLTNVTFSGNSAGAGGGMYNINSSPNLSNVTFSSNSAFYGGGMYNSASNPTLNDVTFSGNYTTGDYGYGGGMYNNNDSSPSLSNVTFSGNSARDMGGGMHNNGSNPSLSNVTFSSNSAMDMGGGMSNSGSSPSLTNVTFTGNYSTGDYGYGGGMANDGSNPTLSDVTFTGNSAIQGGGMSNYYESSPSLTNVTFSGNTASSGGGMSNQYSSSPSLTNVTFTGNSAIQGGGMSNYYESSPSLTNVTFSVNVASKGGGMYNYDSSPSLTNVTFTGNYTTGDYGYGGGMYNYDSSPSLTNVTFTGNYTTGDYGYGGGMFNYYDSSPTVTNSILWGNLPEQIHNGYLGSVTITYSDIQNGFAGIGNIDADPLLGPLVDNGGFTQTHALGEGSPAIDTGDPSNCPVIDQRAYTRPIDGDGNGTATCDMGAFEYASYPATFSLTIDLVGSGSVLKEPDKSEYLWGEMVTLTPVADPDWVFIGWGGDASGLDTPLTVTIYEDTNITANFRFDAWTITLSVFPEGSGEVVAYPDQPTYHYGDQVTLTALPNPGWSFAGWTGDASGTSSQVVVTMNDSLEITANFAQIEYSLSVSVDPPGMGTVTKSPNKPFYIYGDVVTLTSSSTVTGWRFIGWSGDASGVTNPLQVTITANTNITASFSNEYTLSTIVDPIDSGTITRDIYQETYAYGMQVVLTATPNPGWTFAGWGGDASGSDNPLTVTIFSDTNITANFTQDEYTLTVTPIGSGSVVVDPDQTTYHYGDIVTLTPTADPGWTFAGWSGDATGSEDPLTYTIVGNTTITSTFTQDEYTLTVTPIGSGTVAVDPVQATYYYGDVVTLTPTADVGWTFNVWGGDASGSDNPLTYTIIGDTNITANFTQIEYTLTVNIAPVGAGTVIISPMQTTYHYGDDVTLTPVANPGWTFSEWSGDVSGSDNPLTVAIFGDTNITANFTQDEYTLDVIIEGFGLVEIDPVQATYLYGTEVTLTAAADPCWSFAGWGGDASGSDNPFIFTIQGNTNIIALFTTNWIFLPMITR